MPAASAPPFSRQPEPVPHAPRDDGLPYATPLVRGLARVRGVDLARLKPQAGRRHIVAEDLDRPTITEPSAEPVTSPMFLTAEADVSEAVQAAARRNGNLVATVACAFANVLHHSSLHRGPVDLLVAGAGKDDPGGVVLPSAEELSVEGVERGLASPGSTRPNENVPFSILNLTGTALLYGSVWIPAHQVAAVSLGDVRRALVSRADATGVEAICHRSIVGLTLTYDPKRLGAVHAASLLSGIKALLEEKASYSG